MANDPPSLSERFCLHNLLFVAIRVIELDNTAAIVTIEEERAELLVPPPFSRTDPLFSSGPVTLTAVAPSLLQGSQ